MKKLQIREGNSSLGVTLWAPQNTLQVQKGDYLTMYDAKINRYHQQPTIDNTSGTLIEVSKIAVSMLYIPSAKWFVYVMHPISYMESCTWNSYTFAPISFKLGTVTAHDGYMRIKTQIQICY